MKSLFPLSLLVLAPLGGCGAGDDGDPKSETTTPEPTTLEPTPLEQAVAAIGGEDALMSLGRLRVEATGSRRIDFEGKDPSEVVDGSTYATTYLFDLTTDALRLDTERDVVFEAFQFFPSETYGIVLDGDVGGLTAQAGFLPVGALPSQYVGALRTQQDLYNPHLLLREALADPGSAGDGGVEDYEGRPHRILTLSGGVAEIELFVDEETGLISKLETQENSILMRDVPLEVRYRDWQPQGALSFPDAIELYVATGLVHEEVRTAVDLDPTDVPADAFDLPPEAGAPQLDADALAFGEQSHQVVEAFFHIAFGYDEQFEPTTTELSPGVTLIPGGHNSLAVSHDGGLVLIEAPLSPAHGTGLVETLSTAFPGAAITHVVQSHHHQDHASGVRSVAAAGATVVVGNGVADFWDGVFAAPSTVRPDAFSQAGIVPIVEEIPVDGTFVIQDGNVTITAHHVSANPHADDMVITVVDTGSERFVYEGDLYNAGLGFTAVVGGPEAFFAALRDREILDATCASPVPLTIVPTHGVALPLADVLAELSTLGVDVGCP